MEHFEAAVVGSGPTGVVVARLLAEAGIHTVVVDAGQQPATQLSERLAAASQLPWQEWPQETYRNFLRTSARGVGRKTFFGDHFPYDEGVLGMDYGRLKVRASAGAGGFSRVWGATMLPHYRDSWAPELGYEWESSLGEAREISEHIGVAGESGPLSEFYPETGFTHGLPSGSALTALIRSSSFLNMCSGGEVRGLGLPRLAVAERTHSGGFSSGCTSCGLCQVGCPYGHIWTSAGESIRLDKSGCVEKRQGVVTAVADRSGREVDLHYRPASCGSTKLIRAKRVFLAAGPLGTAGILMKSGILPPRVLISDSQTMFVAGISKRPLNSGVQPTLTEGISVCGSVTDRSISHAQLYGPSQYLTYRLSNSINGPLRNVMLNADVVTDRLVVALVYLDGSQSSKLVVECRERGLVRVSSCLPQRRSHADKALAGHNCNLKTLGIRLLPFAKQMLSVGEGNHLGSFLPMRGSSGASDLWADQLGRPFGTGNIFVVDASILPSVQAGPITLMAMANAARIVKTLLGAG
jgi:hypothetical protein